MKVGAINNIQVFTHEGVKFDGSNVACTGADMRLENGNLNTNILQQLHYKIKILPTNLIVSNKKVIDPYTQTVLGPFNSGHASSLTATFIWVPERPQCDKLKMMDATFESTTADVWFNDDTQIQLRVTDTFYDQDCKIKLMNTDVPGL